MSSTLLEVPAEPLPTTHLATRNVHRLTRESPGELVLEPGPADWWAALASLGFLPLILAVCFAKDASLGITVGLSLLPLLAAAGFTVAALVYDRYGTRARFDRDRRRVSVTGWRHGGGLSYPWEGIKAVQFCDPPGKFARSSRVCQVNLVVGSDPLWRINLLHSGGRKQLRRMAAEIAVFLEVPLYVNALAAQDNASGNGSESAGQSSASQT